MHPTFGFRLCDPAYIRHISLFVELLIDNCQKDDRAFSSLCLILSIREERVATTFYLQHQQLQVRPTKFIVRLSISVNWLTYLTGNVERCDD